MARIKADYSQTFVDANAAMQKHARPICIYGAYTHQRVQYVKPTRHSSPMRNAVLCTVQTERTS